MQSDHDRLVRIDENVEHLVLQGSDHEDRIRVMEAQQYLNMGRDAVIAAGVSVTITLTLVWIGGLISVGGVG